MTANNASLNSSNHTDSIKHSEFSDANVTANGRTENGRAENGRAENGRAESMSRESASTDLTISPEDLLAEQDSHLQDSHLPDNQAAEVSMLESAVVQASQASLDLLPDLSEASNGFSTALPKSLGQRAFGIANRMAKATTLENLYQITVTELRKRFKCDRAFIYQFQSLSAGRVIAESMTAGYTPTLGETLSAIAFGASRPQDYQTQRAIAMADASEEAVSPHQMQLLQRFQVRSSLSLPIFVAEHLWGLLVVQQCDAARPWQETDIGLLYQVSTELTLKLQSYQIQQQSQKEIDRGETLSSVIKNIRGFSDIQQIFGLRPKICVSF